VTDPVSLPALMRQEYDGRGLRTGRVLERTAAWTKYAATYRGDGLRISGVLLVPRGRGDGPFPGIVLAHGYIDPAVYTTGRGLRREQDLLARRGFVVLHTDYRNHAGSDHDPRADVDLRLGYTVDTINAVLALQRHPSVDPDRVALLGRSMGGGVVLNTAVVQPGLVDAAVVFASVSSDAVDNYERWTRGEREALARRIEREHGAPEDDPQFWRGISPRTYFDRVTEPVLLHHGTEDDSCPIRWSEETLAALRDAGAAARLYTYEGEQHAFGPQWPRSMERTLDFLERHLDG
jgi:dipeptidyl aminopeptidase/acylaminoacyl peptidase